MELLPAVRIYHIDKVIFFVPSVLLAHDVGEVDEGQHDPLLLHLRLLGDPEVVVAAHTQARLPQEPNEEENHLISTINILDWQEDDHLWDDVLGTAVHWSLLVVAGELDLHNREQVPVPGDRDHAGDHDEQVSVLGDIGGDDDFDSDKTLREAVIYVLAEFVR